MRGGRRAGARAPLRAGLVAMEPAVELPEHRSEFRRRAKRTDSFLKPAQAFVESRKPPNVGQVAARLHGEAEALGGTGSPALDAHACRQAIEGRVDLDGVEALRVQLEP